ncbi:formimidoylglutamase [Deminuibacter soli]|uniref:Arginase n=1 Tax=Deminuibacter soli TaxID=2291815 RepID=A0A3E1NDJ4_9BACT|nr:formimidoylglutamase [Deminuibacter soli]RFM25914.1 arginase [Deminuibacter soli]
MSFPSIETIIDFLEPVNTYELSNDEGFRDVQLGKHIAVYEEQFPDLTGIDIVLVGCGENRGGGIPASGTSAPDAVRKIFYSLYHWHQDVHVADVGNVKAGATLADSYAALRAVVTELVSHGKRVVILGGSHDVTIGQYQVYAAAEKIIEVACVDARIDMDFDSVVPADNFMLSMLTSEPNYIRHYSHIGFQSYLVHPHMLETIDKLRFDCFRVGRVKEHIEEIEPVIRNANMFSFDIAAIQHCHAPANRLTPNGFTGEEACTLMQYAGMSPTIDTIGIYGYLPSQDEYELTAKQISHMLWYLMDGVLKGKEEAPMSANHHFNEFKLAFAELEATFLQSKKTGRWWMQLPDETYIACSYRDYVTAANNDIPERWLRAMERS